MCKYTVSFERPWVFFLLIAAAFLVFFPYFRMPRNKRRTAGRIISLALRCASVVIVLFLLAGATFTETTLVPRSTSMVIVVDYSDSTSSLRDRMDDYVEQMVEQAEAGTKIGAIVFADGTCTASELSSDKDRVIKDYFNLRSTGMATDATDISDALKAAGAMFPGDTQDNKRVVLLSDGRQTSGNAWEAAEILLQRNIRLDAVSFDATSEDFSEVSLTDFAVSPGQVIDHGKSVTLNVKIRSTVETEGTIRFYDGDKQLWSYPVALNIGDNRITQPIEKLEDVGIHALRVELVPADDSISQNNTLCTWVKVNGDAKILIVEGRVGQAERFNEQLESLYETDVITPSQFPTAMEDLLPYDEIVLMDVMATALPDGADQLIDRFVSKLGRGLLTTSGSDTDAYDSYGNTKLGDMLPVTMTLDETINNIAMVLVIDDSGSMSKGPYSSTEKFLPALDGAKACIDALSPNDYVGIVTFHAQSDVKQQLIKATDKDALKELVDGFSTDGNTGTSYSAGLNAAYDMLRGFNGARSKHVIFLSDGEPTDSNYASLPTSMKNQGISLSTIALCATDKAKNTLHKMAQDGNGNFYSIDKDEDLSSLANIMEDLTLKAKEPQFVNTEPFNPKAQDDTGMLSGVDVSQIVMGGYIGSTIKTEAKMSLYNDDFRPIIAEWKWGRGYVTAFMTNLGGEWCEELFTSEYGLRLITNLSSQSLNDEKQSTAMTPSAEQDDRTAKLRVETALDLYGQQITATVSCDDEDDQVISLSKVSTGVYRGAFHTEDPNKVYLLSITMTDAEGAVQDRAVYAYSGGILKEYDLFGQNGEELLASISSIAGGELMKEVDDLYAAILPNVREHTTDALAPCALALLVLLLTDILMRILNFSFGGKKKRR